MTEFYEWRIDRIPVPDGGYGVVCYFRDISPQVRARAAIADSEERYRSLVSVINGRAMDDGRKRGLSSRARARGKPTPGKHGRSAAASAGSTRSTPTTANRSWPNGRKPAPAVPGMPGGRDMCRTQPPATGATTRRSGPATGLRRQRPRMDWLLHGHRGPDSRRASAQGRARRYARGQSRKGRVPRDAFPRAAARRSIPCC